jgi:hypothetical protein
VEDLGFDQGRRLEGSSSFGFVFGSGFGAGFESETTENVEGRAEPGHGGEGVIELEELSRFHSTYSAQDRERGRDRDRREERRMVLEGRSSTSSYYVCCR